tara:strand:- start:306 stop:452 length:147 start_codon:yes stop_codon:yes gene_type:complete
MAQKEKDFRKMIEEAYRKHGGRGKATGELKAKGKETLKKVKPEEVKYA